MDIQCPNAECGKVLSVPDGMRGQTAKCPECDADIPVPEDLPESASECPNCGEALGEGAVICIQCGYNLQTGEKMHTAEAVDDAGEGEDEEEEYEADEAPNVVADIASGLLGWVVRLRYVILVVALIALLLTIFGRWYDRTQENINREAEKFGEAAGELLQNLPQDVIGK